MPWHLYHLGSVQRSTCGERAVVKPISLYSLEAMCANLRTSSGEKVAAKPREPGHIEMAPPPPELNSASALAEWRGSEELLAGMPKPIPSTKACTLLFHLAATTGLSTMVTRIWRRLSSVIKRLWLSVISQGLASPAE